MSCRPIKRDPPFLSLVCPVLNEEASIAQHLAQLQRLRARAAELIVVDGGSRDRTTELARPAADRLLDAPRGRASQMNAGARIGSGRVLLFVHADTRLPAAVDELIRSAVDDGALWGRFDVRIDGVHPL